MMELPKVIAHRGLSALAPENTLVAMQAAQQQGLKWVEFDVQLSADQQPVVFHDDDLDRTSNGSGPLADLTLMQLQQLDVGSWWDNKFVGEKIPTFAEMVIFLAEQGLLMNVELKPTNDDESALVKAVLTVLSHHWPDLLAEPLLSSFQWSVLYELRKQGSSHPLGLLMHEWCDDWLQHANALQVASVNVNQSLLTEERIVEIKSEGYLVTAYTVNDLHRAKQLWDLGVSSVFSDNAHELLAALKTLGQLP